MDAKSMYFLGEEQPRVLVQGITGQAGLFHSRQCLDYGTAIVGGVTPGKGGTVVHGNIPVFNSVSEACSAVSPTVSLILVPAPQAVDAIFEAMDANIPLLVCITEGIPMQDMLRVHGYLRGRPTRLIGPNSPGFIIPGRCKCGIIPGTICQPGRVGVVSRSGTLMFEAIAQLTEGGLGQSAAIGIGGDPMVGTSFVDVLKMFNADPKTDGVVLIGEIGGRGEEQAADYIRHHMQKPVVGFIAGQSVLPEKRMGHAGAIVSDGTGTAASKVQALQAAGVAMAPTIADIAQTWMRVAQRENVRS